MENSEASVSMTSVTSVDLDTSAGRSNEMGLLSSKPEDKEEIVEGAHDDDNHMDEHDHHHDHDDDHQEPQTCREKLRFFLQTQRFHIAVIVLVVLDCIFVIGELILDYEKLANAKCPPTSPPPTEGNSNTSDDSEYSRHRRQAEEHPTEGAESAEHEESAVGKAAEALHILSLIILSVFMVELTLKLIALGTKFFHSKLEVFDGIVIVVSFILDIITLVFPDSFAIVDLIVVLRLWRILRVVNGVILSVEQQAEKKIHHYKRVKDRAVHAAMTYEEYSTALEGEIETLKGLLASNGVKIDEGIFKNIPKKPHYGKNYHDDKEDHHHKHGPLYRFLHHHHDNHHNNHHDNHHDPNKAEASNVDTSHKVDTSQPPDYHSLHHGDHEAKC